jgi:hypothetical protein
MTAVFTLLQLDVTVKWDTVLLVAGFLDWGLISSEYDTVMTGNLLNYLMLLLLNLLSGLSKTALKINWTCCFEISVNNHQSARRHVREACHQQRCVFLKKKILIGFIGVFSCTTRKSVVVPHIALRQLRPPNFSNLMYSNCHSIKCCIVWYNGSVVKHLQIHRSVCIKSYGLLMYRFAITAMDMHCSNYTLW